MRFLLALALTMTWLSSPSAQKLDLDRVSCRELLHVDKQTMTYLIVWLRGFWTKRTNRLSWTWTAYKLMLTA